MNKKQSKKHAALMVKGIRVKWQIALRPNTMKMKFLLSAQKSQWYWERTGLRGWTGIPEHSGVTF